MPKAMKWCVALKRVMGMWPGWRLAVELDGIGGWEV